MTTTTATLSTHYNTTGLSAESAKVAGEKAATQGRLILDFFQAHPRTAYAAHQVHQSLLPALGNAPITSVRRAITNLESGLFLVKTTRTVEGPHHIAVCTWRLNTGEKMEDYPWPIPPPKTTPERAEPREPELKKRIDRDHWARVLERADVRKAFLTAHMANNCQVFAHIDGKSKALDLATHYARGGEIETGRGVKNGLLVQGSYGCGKTHLSTAVFKQLLANMLISGHHDDIAPARWANWPSRVKEIQGGYSDGSSRGQVVMLSSIPLLLIDDIGNETTGSSKDHVELLEEIVNTRHMDELPTIFTSNMDMKRLTDSYGLRLMDRIHEMCASVQMGGRNLRTLPITAAENALVAGDPK